ncbi:MAG TPA: NAD-dependent epimerase/dehydratase family protein [Burkholderiaceae bacterium]|nr:NAD-dependent epimerase/dehydratase family protein [Burkholderiaceae bacterium]
MLASRLDNVEHLEDVMTTPSAALVATLRGVPGDLLVLGVGGKMGPTLARLAKRAAPDKRVIGVARFSEPGLQATLQRHGVECIVADLLSREQLAALPDAPNVVFMAGRKFGSSGSEWLTWAMNAHVPALVAERYAASRIVAFSTACVYPFVDVDGPGAGESAPLTPPPGEYANSCVARERLFQHWSHQRGTAGRLIRLSYAIDMRYGVLHDLARKLVARQSIDLTMGHANIIWQGDANDWALRALAHCTAPTSGLNVSGAVQRIRDLASALAQRLGVQPLFTGSEAPTAWLVDTGEAQRLFGPPAVPLPTMLDWTADWVARDMASLNKPTHYEARDGKY